MTARGLGLTESWFLALAMGMACLQSPACHAQVSNPALLDIQLIGSCKVDSLRLKALTDGTWLGWSQAEGGTQTIRTPWQKTTAVEPLHPITYVATAEFPSQNLVSNGDFEAGAVGFTSDYIRVDTLNRNTRYSVVSRHPVSSSAYVKRGDKTSGMGKMLLVDASTDATKAFYTSKLALKKGLTYTLTVWVCNIHREFARNKPDTTEATTGHLQIDIGTQASVRYRLPLDTAWHPVTTSWTATSNDSIPLQFRSLNTSVEGNDFAIDELSVVSPPTRVVAAYTLSPCSSGTVISPDGDGHYDTFYIHEAGQAKVFDLGGTLVKEIATPGHWDGTHRNGTFVDAGYYAIVVNGSQVHRVSVMR